MKNTKIILKDLKSNSDLKGLTYFGFKEDEKDFNYNSFKILEVRAAYEVVREWTKADTRLYGRLSTTLIDVVENLVIHRTKGKIKKISHGSLILAFYLAGFTIDRRDTSSSSVYINIDTDDMANSIQAYYNRLDTEDFVINKF